MDGFAVTAFIQSMISPIILFFVPISCFPMSFLWSTVLCSVLGFGFRSIVFLSCFFHFNISVDDLLSLSHIVVVGRLSNHVMDPAMQDLVAIAKFLAVARRKLLPPPGDLVPPPVFETVKSIGFALRQFPLPSQPAFSKTSGLSYRQAAHRDPTRRWSFFNL